MGRDHESTVATVSSGESKGDKPASRPGRGRTALDRQLRRAMDANLQELELMHKRVKIHGLATPEVFAFCVVTL